MKHYLSRLQLLTLALLVPMASPGHSPTAAATQSEFEQLARQADTEIVWSSVTSDQIQGSTRLVVTGLEIRTAQARDESMFGVRIDLSDGTASESVYIEEPHIRKVRAFIQQLDEDLQRWGKNPEARAQCLGVYDAHTQEPKYYSLVAEYCVRDDFEGLSVSTLRKHRFELPGVRPKFLLEVLDSAASTVGHREQAVQETDP